jgi:hypothetical protein
MIRTKINASLGSISNFSQTAGVMLVEDNFFVPPATLTQALINSTGGTAIIDGNTAQPGTSGVAVNITTDVAGNSVRNNDFKQYTYAFPSGTVFGYYVAGNGVANMGSSGHVIGAPYHWVIGSSTLSGGTVSQGFTNEAAFTSNVTYNCVATDTTTSAATAINCKPTSGAAMTCTGAGTDTFSFLCFGS